MNKWFFSFFIQISLVLPLSGLRFSHAASAAPEFRMAIQAEPKSLDRTSSKNILGNTLQQITWRSLVKIVDDQIQMDLAESCSKLSPLKYTCKLKRKQYWSDGKEINIGDFEKTFNLLKQKNSSEDVQKIISKIARVKTELINQTISFELSESDPLFLYRLASPLFSPYHESEKNTPQNAKNLVTSGPFKIEKWLQGQKIELTPNPYHSLATSGLAPSAKIILFFVADDTLAYKLYERNELDLLRRLPAPYFNKYAQSKELIIVPTARFDYIGFGPNLSKLKSVRKSLTEALNYDIWKKVLSAEFRPGCPSLPENFFVKMPCYETQTKNLTIPINEKPKSPLLFIYSQQGGEDHRRGAEWLQQEWKTKAQLDVKIQSLENAIFNEVLQKNPPDLFRKGMPLSIPHCAEALENFTTQAADNRIHFKNSTFDQVVKELEQTLDPKKAKELCQKGTQILLDEYALIPLGQIAFHTLIKPKWTGIRFNSLNQIDLTNLKEINN